MNTPPVALTLPAPTFAETVNDESVPTDVMLACAAPDTVLATDANATVPDTFAPATALAVAAKLTSPATFAPCTLETLPASPCSIPTTLPMN